MKFSTTKAIALSFLGAALALTSCGKKTVSSNPAGSGKNVVIELPCQKEGQNTKDFFRARSTGESSDLETSRKKAKSNVRAELAANINTTVKTVTDNFVNSREYSNVEEIEERYESLSRELVDQELRGLNTICEVTTQNSETGKYTTYVAMELSGENLVTKMNETISKDERLKVDYDYEKFKETFDAEMDKMAQ